MGNLPGPTSMDSLKQQAVVAKVRIQLSRDCSSADLKDKNAPPHKWEKKLKEAFRFLTKLLFKISHQQELQPFKREQVQMTKKHGLCASPP